MYSTFALTGRYSYLPFLPKALPLGYERHWAFSPPLPNRNVNKVIKFIASIPLLYIRVQDGLHFRASLS